MYKVVTTAVFKNWLNHDWIITGSNNLITVIIKHNFFNKPNVVEVFGRNSCLILYPLKKCRDPRYICIYTCIFDYYKLITRNTSCFQNRVVILTPNWDQMFTVFWFVYAFVFLFVLVFVLQIFIYSFYHDGSRFRNQTHPLSFNTLWSYL